jgi:serine protease Do
MGLIGTVTEGVISAFRKDKYRELIQIDVPINPGNSGGALVDLEGELVGVNTQKYVHTAVEGIAFAISSNTVKQFIEEQIEKGKLQQELAEIV